MRRSKRAWSVVLVLILINILPLQAEVRLAGIFSSEMVLQRNHEIGVWGWADKGERITGFSLSHR
ncbi:MAG: hypothetical protein WD824_21845 [Cyclobacteriaceae bacterium]